MKPVLNLFFALALSLLFFSCQNEKAVKKPATAPITKKIQSQKPQLDTVDYNQRMLALSNQDTTGRWPAESPYPLVGAILPYQRIIAFYGNLYSKRMGVLGEYPKDEMLQKLQLEVAKWQAADSTVQAIPALHYIAVSAQSQPGKANRYNMRMPFKQID
ncbi:MAG: hypothetical protein ACK4M4_09085, partial [Flavobacterium sp.]